MKREIPPEISELLIAHIKEENKSITHEEFAEGAKNGTMGFKVMLGEPSDLISGSGKTTFNLLVMLYTVGPLIIVPILSFSAGNWWLLFGIAFSYAFSFLATFKQSKFKEINWVGNTIIYFILFCIGYWFLNGFHFYDYITFFFFCSLFGHFLFLMAEDIQDDYAMQMLVENPALFSASVASNKIMIVRKNK